MLKDFIRKKVQAAVDTAWATSPPCKLVWENQPEEKNPKGPWCRASLRYGVTEPAAVGAQFTRTSVTLRMRVYIPKGDGTAETTQAADRVDSAFLFKELGYVGPGGEAVTISGDQGCVGPLSAGDEGGYAVFELTSALRYDVGRPTLSE